MLSMTACMRDFCLFTDPRFSHCTGSPCPSVTVNQLLILMRLVDILVKSCQSCRCMQGKSHKACKINIEILNIRMVSSCLHQFTLRAWQTNFRFVRLCFMFQSKSRRRQPSASFQLISRLRNWNIDERLRSIWYDSSHQPLKV